jgi:hypothetical protein
MEKLKERKSLSELFGALNENNLSPWIFYLAKLSFKIDRAIKILHNKQNLKQYMTTISPLRRFYKEFCTQKMKANKTHKKKGSIKPQEKKDK